MKRAKNPSKAQALANVFAVLGYISLAFQWLWVATLTLPWLLKQDTVVRVIYPTGTKTPEPAPEMSVDPILSAILVVFSLCIVVVSIYLALKIPKKFVQSTSRTTTHTASRLVALTEHRRHKPFTKAQRLQATRRSIFVLKTAATVIGFGVILVASSMLPMRISPLLAFTIGLMLSAWPPVWFILQYFAVRFGGKNTRIL